MKVCVVVFVQLCSSSSSSELSREVLKYSSALVWRKGRPQPRTGEQQRIVSKQNRDR